MKGALLPFRNSRPKVGGGGEGNHNISFRKILVTQLFAQLCAQLANKVVQIVVLSELLLVLKVMEKENKAYKIIFLIFKKILR